MLHNPNNGKHLREPPARTRADWPRLLDQRIRESGLSTTVFAREVLRRDPRTLRRWRRGESPIPAEVQDFLARPTPAPWPPPRALK